MFIESEHNGQYIIFERYSLWNSDTESRYKTLLDQHWNYVAMTFPYVFIHKTKNFRTKNSRHHTTRSVIKIQSAHANKITLVSFSLSISFLCGLSQSFSPKAFGCFPFVDPLARKTTTVSANFGIPPGSWASSSCFPFLRCVPRCRLR